MVIDNTYDWLEEAMIKDMQLGYKVLAAPSKKEQRRLVSEAVPEITRLLRGWYADHKTWLADGRVESRDEVIKLLKRYKIL